MFSEPFLRFCGRQVFAFGLVCAAHFQSAQAEITVEGVRDKQVLTDRAPFRVMPVEGYDYGARLNGTNIALSAWIEVARPGYYELALERTQVDTGAREEQSIQFIVRSSERGGSELGLAPWVPLPPVQSATAEFAGFELRLVVPPRLPGGLEVPVIALVRTAEGEAARVNGIVHADGFAPFQLRRGFGSTLLPALSNSNAFAYVAGVGELTAEKQISVDLAPNWTAVAGAVSGTQDWAEDSLVYVASNLVLSADATLTIGAGSIVRLAAGVEIRCEGKFIVEGTDDRPVLFAPETRDAPWGGFVLRTATAQLEMNGAILTGSGANPDWFDANPGSGDSHRHEQPLIYLANGARAALTNCYLVSNAGQAAHGEDAFLSMTGCLVQQCITTGQFNGGAVDLRQSAFIEFPKGDGVFSDADNDAIYFTEGEHSLTDCLVGWARDDGIDAGSGGAGKVTVTRCWIESCFHEALAWSGTGRIAHTRDTVILNSGQGVEAGWNSPDVLADHCLVTGNLVGARFGDNYEWTYDGLLRVTNSFLLFNDRNVWGRTWDNWTERLDRMDVRQNELSAADASHPTNSVWKTEDGGMLAAFLPGLDAKPVGVAFALWGNDLASPRTFDGIPVGLSRFSTITVTVDYAVEGPQSVLATGTLEFAPGQTVQQIPASSIDAARGGFMAVMLRNAIHAEVTGEPLVLFPDTDAVPDLILPGSEWRFLDRGIEPPGEWRSLDFDDSSWTVGRAELGFGDGDEATVINGGPSNDRFPTAYFRRLFTAVDPAAYSDLTLSLRRDDGAVVYLNGREAFRNNMPAGPVDFRTWADSSSTSETKYFTAPFDPTWLLAGTNVVAVEVHQSSDTSSDLSFDLALSARPQPKLQFQSLSGGRVWLQWSDENLELEEATTVVGPWRPLNGASSPVLVTPGGTRFYRVPVR